MMHHFIVLNMEVESPLIKNREEDTDSNERQMPGHKTSELMRKSAGDSASFEIFSYLICVHVSFLSTS